MMTDRENRAADEALNLPSSLTSGHEVFVQTAFPC